MDDQLTELKIQNLLSVINIMSNIDLDKDCMTYKILDYIFNKEMKDLQMNLLYNNQKTKQVNNWKFRKED